MRNPILPIAIAFVVAAPCTAIAGGKKEKSIEVNSFSFGQANSGTAGVGGAGAGATSRVGSPTTKAPTTTPTAGNATTRHK